MHVLDTSILVDYFNGTLPKEHIALLQNSAISILSVAELADKFTKEHTEFTPVRQFLEQHIHIHPITTTIAHQAAKIKHHRRKKHPAFGIADALILATAKHHKQTLYTKDNDFREEAQVLEY